MAEAVTRKPYVEEAERRVAERRKELKLYDHARLSDDTIVSLMADYAAESWQEGRDEGYAAAENDES